VCPSAGAKYLPATLQDLARLMPQVAGVRRWGAAALDLAYVAAGRYDGYWERGLNAWDVAAGILLVREAGGLVEPMRRGIRTFWRSGQLIGGAGAIFDRFAGVIRERPQELRGRAARARSALKKRQLPDRRRAWIISAHSFAMNTARPRSIGS
jgi:hypothetical protein